MTSKERSSAVLTEAQQRVVEFLENAHERTVLKTLGCRVESYDPLGVTVAVDASERLFQPMGIVHGGIYVLLAETAASIAAALEIDAAHFSAVGMEINANHLRPVTEGTIQAKASLLHKGRTSLVYQIDVTDQKGRRVCVSRCTMAIRPHEER